MQDCGVPSCPLMIDLKFSFCLLLILNQQLLVLVVVNKSLDLERELC
jgi:hypothetical protein